MLHKRALAASIYAQESKEQEREAPQRRTAVTEKRQRYADNGREAHDHAYVDKDVEEQDAHHAIAVDAPEHCALALGKIDEPQDEREKQQKHGG